MTLWAGSADNSPDGDGERSDRVIVLDETCVWKQR